MNQLGLSLEVVRGSVVGDALDRHYTSVPLARQIVQHLVAQGCRPKRVIETCVGGGSFIVTGREAWPDAHMFGSDVDPRAKGLDLCDQYRMTPAQQLGNLPEFKTPSPGDLVLTNPPFSTKTAAQYQRARSVTEACIRLGSEGWVALIVPGAWFIAGGEKFGWLHEEPWRADEILVIEGRPWPLVRDVVLYIRRPPALRTGAMVIRDVGLKAAA